MDDSHPPRSRLPERLVAGTGLAVLVLGALRIFAVSERAFVAAYAHDDSYYYFQIARNIARGIGPSFDGLEWTNGFTPVWGALLVPVFALVDDPDLAARTSCALGLALFVLALVLLARLLTPVFGAWPSAIASVAALSSGPLRDLGHVGMDFSLNLFQQVTLIWAFVRLGEHPRPWGTARLLGVGVLAGLMCIQRPDTSLLAVLMALPVLVPRTGRLRAALLLAAGALLVGAPYLVGSKLAFGTALPVSGQLKGFNAAAIRERDGLGPCGDMLAYTAAGAPVQPLQSLAGGALTGADDLAPGARRLLLLGLVVAAAAGAARARHARTRTAVAAPILVHGLLHAGVVAVYLFPYAHYGNWYFAPEAMAGVVLVAAASSAVARRLPARGATALAACVLALAAGGMARHELDAWRAPEPPDDQLEAVSLPVAEYLRDELGPGTRIGVFNAGRVGYFADVHVVNLDGLVNTISFAEDVWMSNEGSFGARFLKYAIEKELEWFVDAWNEPLEMVALHMRPKARAFFTLERTWPTRTTFATDSPGSYQLVRFDLEGARAALVAADLTVPESD